MVNVVIVLKEAQECSKGNRARLKLEQMLRKIGADLTQIVITYKEIADKVIEENKPNIIITMGTEAFKAFCPEEKILGIKRGDFFQTASGIKLLATFHPNFLYQNWDNQEIIEYDLRKAWKASKTKEMPLLWGQDYFVCLTLEDVYKARDYLLNVDKFSFDVETEGFDIFDKDEILCIQFSSQEGEGIVIPLRGAWRRHPTAVYSDKQLEQGFWRFVEDEEGNTVKLLCKNEKGKPQIIKPIFAKDSIDCVNSQAHFTKTKHICRGKLTDVWDGPLVNYYCNSYSSRMCGKLVPETLIEVIKCIREILESNIPKIAQNGKFDIHAVHWQYGIITHNFIYDTMLAYHLYHENRPHRLEVIQARHSTMPQYKHLVKPYISPGVNGSYAEIPNNMLYWYSAMDADCEFRLIDPLLEEIEKDNPENGLWLFNNIDMPYNRALVQIENNGMLVDMDRFWELAKIYHTAIDNLKNKIDQFCDEHGLSRLEVYNNPNTLRPFLYDREYEIVTQKEKWHKCKKCKGSDKSCDCEEGKILVQPETVKIMRGMGLPTWCVPRTAKTDEEKTDKRAFTALKSWCTEDVLYTINYKNGKAIRVPTKQKLSEKEIKQRSWKRDLLILISQYKQAVQARNLFLDGNPDKDIDGPKAMLAHVRDDGRVHCNFMQLTKTSRLSSSNPNTQNIANEDDEGEIFYGYGIRTMFTALEEYELVEADYSAQEMRIVAYLSNDKNLLDIFFVCPECQEDFRPTKNDPERPWKFRTHCEETGHEAADLHRATAAKVFNVPYEEVTSHQRTFAKRVNFGINYVQSAKGLAEVLGISVSQAQKLIDDYFIAFPGIKSLQNSIRKATIRGEKIPNAYGRYLHNYGILEMKNFVDKKTYEQKVNALVRRSVNYPEQSSPADIIGNVAIALADVWGVEHEDWQNIEAHQLAYEICGFNPATHLWELGVRTINLVHDSVLFEIPNNSKKESIDIITTIMERLPWIQLGWMLPVDVKSGPYWGYHEKDTV